MTSAPVSQSECSSRPRRNLRRNRLPSRHSPRKLPGGMRHSPRKLQGAMVTLPTTRKKSKRKKTLLPSFSSNIQNNSRVTRQKSLVQKNISKPQKMKRKISKKRNEREIDLNCKACLGKHRAHTCREGVERASRLRAIREANRKLHRRVTTPVSPKTIKKRRNQWPRPKSTVKRSKQNIMFAEKYSKSLPVVENTPFISHTKPIPRDVPMKQSHILWQFMQNNFYEPISDSCVRFQN